MSGDLISREVLIKVVENSMKDNPHKDSKIAINHSTEHLHFIKLIAEIPTVYDVEKVVEQIKHIGTAYCSSVVCDNECLNCDHGVIMREIIKIVQKGGVVE